MKKIPLPLKDLTALVILRRMLGEEIADNDSCLHWLLMFNESQLIL